MDNIESIFSIFKDSPSLLTSDKYQFIRTSSVLGSLFDLGWIPITASEVKDKKTHTKEFQNHLTILFNPGVSYVKEVGSEIILTNSHNGSDLWRIYNRGKENLTRGNFEIETKKGRRLVSLRSITKNIRMNENPCPLAKSYL